MEVVEKRYRADINNLHEVLDFLEAQLESYGAGMKMINIMQISLEEMFANVCMYAYVDQGIIGDCDIAIWLDDNNMVNVRLTDSGMYFNPLDKVDPDIHAAAEDRGVGGLGIYMVKKYMDECKYEYIDNKNIFTMIKELN